MNGIDATARIVELHPDIRVLVLTTFDLDEYAFAALRAGASGFLLKDAGPAELVSAIRAVAAGEAVVAPRVTRRLLEMFAGRLPSSEDPQVTPTDSRLDDLTPREIEVLRAVAHGLSNAEIADQLVVTESTVKTHVGRVLAKLGVRDRVQAVIVAYETGLGTRRRDSMSRPDMAVPTSAPSKPNDGLSASGSSGPCRRSAVSRGSDARGPAWVSPPQRCAELRFQRQRTQVAGPGPQGAGAHQRTRG